MHFSKTNSLARASLLALALLLGPSPLAAEKKSEKDTPPACAVMGWVEYIAFDGMKLKAKLDPGSKTSSIHASEVRIFRKKTKSGKKKRWVSFTFDYESQNKKYQRTYEVPVKRFVRIKEHHGDYYRRPVVELDFCINGENHRASFNLANRSVFNYPVILGRSFLKDVAYVDSGRTFINERECPPKTTLRKRSAPPNPMEKNKKKK